MMSIDFMVVEARESRGAIAMQRRTGTVCCASTLRFQPQAAFTPLRQGGQVGVCRRLNYPVERVSPSREVLPVIGVSASTTAPYGRSLVLNAPLFKGGRCRIKRIRHVQRAVSKVQSTKG